MGCVWDDDDVDDVIVELCVCVCDVEDVCECV